MKIATKKTLQTVMLVALCASAAGVTTYVVNKKTASKQEPTLVVAVRERGMVEQYDLLDLNVVEKIASLLLWAFFLE